MYPFTFALFWALVCGCLVPPSAVCHSVRSVRGWRWSRSPPRCGGSPRPGRRTPRGPRTSAGPSIHRRSRPKFFPLEPPSHGRPKKKRGGGGCFLCVCVWFFFFFFSGKTRGVVFPKVVKPRKWGGCGGGSPQGVLKPESGGGGGVVFGGFSPKTRPKTEPCGHRSIPPPRWPRHETGPVRGRRVVFF